MKMFEKLTTFIICVFPILDIYCLPIGPNISIGYYCLLLLILVSFIINKKTLANIPKSFYPYIIYIVSITYLEVLDDFKMSSLIPGGLTFFMWMVSFLFILQNLNIKLFRSIYRYVYAVCAILLFVQEIFRMNYGTTIPLILPLPLTDGLSNQTLLLLQMAGDRSCSVFREPSHVAVFALPLLAIEIFEEKKFLNYWSLFIIISLLVLQSGTGLLGLLLLIIFKSLIYFKNVRSRKKIQFLTIIIPVSIFALSLYLDTHAGDSISQRVENVGVDEDSESYDRLSRGIEFYSKLPFVNQIVGIPDADMTKYIYSTGMQSEFQMNMVDDREDTYLNGSAHMLVYNGIIGFILFAYFYFKNYQNNSNLGKASILLIALLMFVGQIYLTFLMLILTCFAFNNKQQRHINNEYLI